LSLAVTSVQRAATALTHPAHVGLHLGARGPAVAHLQRLLTAKGYRPGGVDGWFGPKTLAAVKAYQRRHGLLVDGYVGPITWRSLEPSASSSAPAPAAPSSPARTRVPFFSQMRVPNGYAHYACGPTSLAMVMAAEGKAPPSVLQVCLRAGTQRSPAGTSHDGLIRAARSYGFSPRTGFGWNALAQKLAQGHPVVAHIDTAPLSNRPYGYAGGHYVVITGFVRNSAGRITHVVCNDPATSYASRGQGIRYPVGEFERAWAAKSRWFLSMR
jgi:hypothetical protein